MTTVSVPETDEELAEVKFGESLVQRLVGAKIVMFGANEDGEIWLRAEKEDESIEVVIGNDESGSITLYEIEEDIYE